MIFGVFCLIFGVVSGCKNLMETGMSLAGPDMLERMGEMSRQMGQTLSETQQRDYDMQVEVLRKPVYRVGQGIESAGSAVMAVLLIVGGIGLLIDRPWALKLTRWWSFYAIPAAACSVVLAMRYVYPEMPDAPVGGAVIAGAMMLLALWAFPVLLLKVLPSATVKSYLAERDKQRAHAAPAHPQATAQPSPPPPPPAAPLEPPGATTPQPPPPATRPMDNTWRDDPWNDPNSR